MIVVFYAYLAFLFPFIILNKACLAGLVSHEDRLIKEVLYPYIATRLTYLGA